MGQNHKPHRLDDRSQNEVPRGVGAVEDVGEVGDAEVAGHRTVVPSTAAATPQHPSPEHQRTTPSATKGDTSVATSRAPSRRSRGGSHGRHGAVHRDGVLEEELEEATIVDEEAQ